jgi:hypothetical protein
MSLLSDFEDRVAGIVEGLFAGTFRSPVQPVEIARTLARAMDDGRVLGVGKIYAPSVYTVALSTGDRERFGRFTTALAGELAIYLADHARASGYELTRRPRVAFDTHPDLKLGRFRVATELALGDEFGAQDAVGVEAPSWKPSARADDEKTSDFPSVTVGDPGHDVALRGERVVVGRLAECGIRVSDANVSRMHAAFVHEGDGWFIEDLDSTNGTLLNGAPVSRARLAAGDVVQVGLTSLVFNSAGG